MAQFVVLTEQAQTLVWVSLAVIKLLRRADLGGGQFGSTIEFIDGTGLT